MRKRKESGKKTLKELKEKGKGGKENDRRGKRGRRETNFKAQRKPRKGGIEAVIVDLLYQFFITEEGEYSTDNS